MNLVYQKNHFLSGSVFGDKVNAKQPLVFKKVSDLNLISSLKI